MKRLLIAFMIALVGLAGALAACRPAPAPAPKATPAPTPAAKLATPPPTPAAPTLSPKEAEWQKVVDAAKKEGVVNFYNGGDMDANTRKAITQAFQGKYGIKLEQITARGTEMVEKLKAEARAKAYAGDVINIGIDTMTSLKLAGLLEGYVWLPTVDEPAWTEDPWAFDKDKAFIISGKMTIDALAVLINTNLIKPGQEPKSYDDLMDPKYKGKIILVDPRLGSMGIGIYTRIQQYAKDQKWLEEFFRTQRPTLVKEPVEVNLAVARGEYMIGTPNPQAIPSIKEGAPLKFAHLKPAAATGLNLSAAIKNAPNPNAARVFMNWLHTKEGQDLYGNTAATYISLRKDVPISEDAKIAMPPPEMGLKVIYSTVEEKEISAKNMPLVKEMLTKLGY